jgi:hypothetical protein
LQVKKTASRVTMWSVRVIYCKSFSTSAPDGLITLQQRSVAFLLKSGANMFLDHGPIC